MPGPGPSTTRRVPTKRGVRRATAPCPRPLGGMQPRPETPLYEYIKNNEQGTGWSTFPPPGVTAQHRSRHGIAGHSTAQHSATQHNTAQQGSAQHGTATYSTRHNTSGHSTVRHGTAQHAAKYSTAQAQAQQRHHTAQHKTAQHNAARPSAAAEAIPVAIPEDESRGHSDGGGKQAKAPGRPEPRLRFHHPQQQ